jgi:hypothetical protein
MTRISLADLLAAEEEEEGVVDYSDPDFKPRR